MNFSTSYLQVYHVATSTIKRYKEYKKNGSLTVAHWKFVHKNYTIENNNNNNNRSLNILKITQTFVLHLIKQQCLIRSSNNQ